MDRTSLGILASTFVAWGLSSFVEKLAANRIGAEGVFWHAMAYALVVAIYSLLIFKLGPLMHSTPSGTGLALLGGALSAFGIVGSYLLLTRGEASRIIPLTALYPALSAVLAILFLHESKDPLKLLGIALSLVSIFLLTR